MSDDGEFTELDSVANNANAEMPRSYHRGNDSYGDYYNWHSATAESYAGGTVVKTTDSICPNGWELPAGNTVSDDRSYFDLFVTAYDFMGGNGSGNAEVIRKIVQTPFKHVGSGMIREDGELFYSNSIYVWTGTAFDNTRGRILHAAIGSDFIHTGDNYDKNLGAAIRCVKN